MRTKLPAFALAVAMISGPVSTAAAQTLADVARKEGERRKTVKEPAKVLTNDDLGTVPPISPPPATLFGPAEDVAGAATTDQPDAAGSEKSAEATKEGSGEAPAKDQEYWSTRTKELQTQISRNESFAAALQSQINALTADYTNESDPVRQAKLQSDRQAALSDLDRVNKQLEDDKKAMTGLQEEARRSNVPAGWLR